MATKQQIRDARVADLFAFLKENYPEEYHSHDRCLHPDFNPSISIKPGYSGYYDFSTGEHGNPIDYLMRYHGFSFLNAVVSLLSTDTVISDTVRNPGGNKDKQRTAKMKKFMPPRPARDKKEAYRYLTEIRKLSADTISRLMCFGFIYQDIRNNAVFINPERDWGELRGTSGLPFHGMIPRSLPDRYWYFCPDIVHPYPYFICEGSIDAVSLYELRRDAGDVSGTYVSIGGAAKQKPVDRILSFTDSVVIATDGDKAGDSVRDRNPSLKTVRPVNKDWNDDLRMHRS